MEPTKKKILIAEDETAIASALELKFSHEGFEVKIAKDGDEALNLIKTEPFSLVLMDLMMDKKDGFTVLEEMQKNNITIPVVVISNLGQDEDKARAEKLGAIAYFVKSNTPLYEIVERVKGALQKVNGS